MDSNIILSVCFNTSSNVGSNMTTNVGICMTTRGPLGFGENMKIETWGPRNGLPEFLVDAELIFRMRIFTFQRQKYKKMFQNGKTWPQRFFEMFQSY